MVRQLTDKRILVTGASSGIGLATAQRLTAAGAKVAMVARSADKLHAVARECGGYAIPGDITRADDRDRIIQTAVEAFGGLDVLINNAGIASWGHFATSTEAINRQILETNFFAPVELTRLAIPHLSEGNQPAVVNITSMTGRRGMPAWPEYSASKAALVGISEAWRGEFVRFGVDVITIVPGLTKTNLNQSLLRHEGKAELPEGMSPDIVADAVVKALQSNTTEVIVGSEARKILLMNKFFPRLLNRLIARKITKLYQSEA